MSSLVPYAEEDVSPNLSSELSDAEDVDEDVLGLDDEEEFDVGVVTRRVADDDDEDDEEEDEEEEIDDFEPISEDEANYKIEDPDEMDEDLELRDEDEEEPRGPRKLTLKLSPNKKKLSPIKNRATPREARKRQLTLYEEDGDEEEDEEDAYLKKPRSSKPALDADLILTDEETEYDPHANPDVSKMTERQRSRFLEEGAVNDGSNKFIELTDLKKPNGKKKQSDEVIALRKAESARRREDYKNKQMEEEKKDTLNKLLKRRANKTRGDDDQDGEDGPVKTGVKLRRPIETHPGLFRWVNSSNGTVLGVPSE